MSLWMVPTDYSLVDYSRNPVTARCVRCAIGTLLSEGGTLSDAAFQAGVASSAVKPEKSASPLLKSNGGGHRYSTVWCATVGSNGFEIKHKNLDFAT